MGKTGDIRLYLGSTLRRVVLAQGGTDEDIGLVLTKAPDFMEDVASEMIKRARIIRSSRGDLTLTEPQLRLLEGDVVIHIPALFRPTLGQLQAKYSWIRDIESDTSPVGPVTLRLATILTSTEERVNGEVYERRLEPHREQGLILGFQHREWLLKNQNRFPAFMALLGKVYIDFSGIIVVREDGNRSVPCVDSDGGQFVEYWDWLDCDFFDLGRFAFFSK